MPSWGSSFDACVTGSGTDDELQHKERRHVVVGLVTAPDADGDSGAGGSRLDDPPIAALGVGVLNPVVGAFCGVVSELDAVAVGGVGDGVVVLRQLGNGELHLFA